MRVPKTSGNAALATIQRNSQWLERSLGEGSTWTCMAEDQKETGGGGLVRQGFGSRRKQFFVCFDQVRLQNLFLNLHLRTMTLKVKQLS